MSASKLNVSYPCLSKRSVVNMGRAGIVWATHGGLAGYSVSTGIRIITEDVHDWDTWAALLTPSTLVGHYYNGKYFGSYTDKSFIFEEDKAVSQSIVGFFVTISYVFTAAYTDPTTGILYYTKDSSGEILQWDDTAQILAPLEWKSKTITTPDYMNFGAARVIADYTVTDEETLNITNYNNSIAVSNAAIWSASQQLGTVNGPTDYMSGSVRDENSGTLNAYPINGDGQTQNLKDVSGTLPVTFKLFSEKELIFQGTVSSDDIFRLPSGYRSDTFEVAVSGSARIRAIHIGETPYGLRTA